MYTFLLVFSSIQFLAEFFNGQHDVNCIMTLKKLYNPLTTVPNIQGGPEKTGMAYFPQYVDAITNISV